jgi:formamidopyrimidine-DNA glycosylase
MPELPEVEYVRRQLHRAMDRRRIRRVIARRPDLRYPLPRDFAARLAGQTVRRVRRRAKYLLLEVGSGDVVLMHLGMTGSFRVVHPDDTAIEAHDHVIFEMSTGELVIFNDPRRFGFMRIIASDAAAADAALAPLGPEPLDTAFTADALAPVLAKRRTSLKNALSDQRVVAGLGNIYVVEALHRARLSPKRRASTLVARGGAPRPALVALVDAIKAVLNEALANSNRMYGEDRFRVYDREGDRCPRRGCTGTITRIVQGGRSTFYCPVCQR